MRRLLSSLLLSLALASNAFAVDNGYLQPFLNIDAPNQIDGVSINPNIGAPGNFTNLKYTGRIQFSVGSITATGTNKATAAQITVDTNSVASTGTGQGVILPTSLVGSNVLVTNTSVNSINVYPGGTDTINGVTTAYVVPAFYTAQCFVSVAGAWNCVTGNIAPVYQYSTNTATSGTTLTAANITGGFGFQDITLGLTGTLGGAANAQLPTVANLTTGIINPYVGQSYRLRIINSSSANFTWTVTTNTGWTLTGTMTIPQNTWRDFYVTITGTGTTATLQSIGTGTNS